MRFAATLSNITTLKRAAIFVFIALFMVAVLNNALLSVIVILKAFPCEWDCNINVNMKFHSYDNVS